MRALALCGALLLTLLPGPAPAEGLNNLKAGINSVAAFPADPIVMLWTPPDDFEELPSARITSRLLAIPAGTLLSAHRLAMGIFDIAFTPFWVFPTMSPPARWPIFEEVEYE